MSDPILHGKSEKEGVVGLHEHGGDMKVYTKDGSEIHEFHPFVHVKNGVADRLSDAFNVYKDEHLDGSQPYSRLAWLHDLSQFYDVKEWLRDQYEEEDYYIQHSPTAQFLQQTGITLFKGMSMSDVDRMAIDIETYSKGGFPDSSRESDEIIIISIAEPNGWTELLHTADVNIEGGMQLSSEKEMLQQLLRVIHRRDPDVISGHNTLGFDLPYLRDRFEMHGIKFGIGRDNSEPKTWTSTKEFAEREQEYENFVVAGRSVVDSYFLASDYDNYARELPSYGLKPIARHFGVASENREYVKGENISQVWDESPKRLLKYALDDAVETTQVVNQLGNASFALSKLVPMTWQETIIAGTASTLESIMTREYIRQGHSLPNGSEPEKFEGAYTQIFWRGVFEDLAYEDVSSLYPSIMLHWDVKPNTDELDVFYPMLDQLTSQRLENKRKLKELEEGTQEYERVDAEQAAQKILINSSYGMLGFPYAIFSDIEKAAFVTRKGREILKHMIQVTESEGARVISCDTDGLLFEIPSGRSADDIIAYVDSTLPDGIEIDKDYETDRVVSYKSKNYAKVTGDDMDVSGASLMGRQKEPFLREYINRQLWNLAHRDIEKVKDTHESYQRKIKNGELSAEDLCRNMNLKKTMEGYKKGLEENPNKHRLAQYEVALRKWEITGVKPKKGDTVQFYVRYEPATKETKVSRDARLKREYSEDEDRSYYLGRLDTTADLFRPFFNAPDRVFDSDANQQSLFGLDPLDGVEIVSEQLKSIDR